MKNFLLLNIAIFGLIGGGCFVNKRYFLTYLYKRPKIKLDTSIKTLIVSKNMILNNLVNNKVHISLQDENSFSNFFKINAILKSENNIRSIIVPIDSKYMQKQLSQGNIVKNNISLTQDYFDRILPLMNEAEAIDGILFYNWNINYIISYLKYQWGLPLEIYKEIALFYQIIKDKNLKYKYGFMGNSKKYGPRLYDQGNNISSYHISSTLLKYFWKLCDLTFQKNIKLIFVYIPNKQDTVKTEYIKVKKYIKSASDNFKNVYQLDLSEKNIDKKSSVRLKEMINNIIQTKN